MRISLVALLASFARVAHAGDDEGGDKHIQYDHKHQIGVQVDSGLGYRVLFPYNNTGDVIYCGQTAKSVCTGRSPAFLDLGLSYGISHAIELLVGLRLGVESDFVPSGTTGSAPQQVALEPGLRLYVDDSGSMKFFTTIQLSFDFTDWKRDFTGGKTPASTDFGVRNVNGLLLDLHNTMGVYFFFGETIGFVRWLRFEIDAGVGLQVRFP
jgi:hypothetical protein